VSTATRVYGLTALAALAGAVTLHLGVMAGHLAWWPAMVRLALFGWITGFILAVSHHAMPVFLARDFPRPAATTAAAGLFAATTAAAAAVDLGRPALGTWASGAQALVGALFVGNVVSLVARGRRRPVGPPLPPGGAQRAVDRLASRATCAAGVALPLSLGLLAAAEADRLAPSWRLAAEHLATLGWIVGMVVGVGYHVLPRASGRPVEAAAPVRAQLALHGAAVALMVPALGFGWPRLFALGAALMAASLGVFAALMWPSLAAARRPGPPAPIAPASIEVRR